MTITADNLNNVIEFDSPFEVTEHGDVIHNLTSVYAPTVEHDEDFDFIVDGVNPIYSKWQAFSAGYTGQDRYNGPVMHQSEQLSGGLAEDILSEPGTYVITAVEVNCEVDSPDCGSPYDRATSGCDCFPAGWIVLKLNES